MNGSRTTPHASSTDLLAAVVTLVPVVTAEVPTSLARAAHAWLLDRIGAFDAALATRLHDEEAPRPFTVSNLWGAGPAREGRVTLNPGHTCWLRFTGLTAEVSAAIERALPAPGEILSFAGAGLRVAAATTGAAEHPWAGRAAYTDLMQRYALTPGPHPRGVTLRFASPTAFRSHGRDLPLPLPGLVFDGLLRKWNGFSPLTLPEEAKRYAEECVPLGRFRLHSHWVSFENGDKGAQVGFTGEVRFRFLVGDGYWTRVMTLLAGYAFRAGVGYRTTMGMGQTQAVGSQ